MKTVTMLVDDMIKLVVESQKRSLSNFIEFVDSSEMKEISSDKELVENLMNGLEDFKNSAYKIV